jgi:hypothetical protein
MWWKASIVWGEREREGGERERQTDRETGRFRKRETKS